MFCKNCGAKLEDDALFCEKCGTAVGETGDGSLSPYSDNLPSFLKEETENRPLSPRRPLSPLGIVAAIVVVVAAAALAVFMKPAESVAYADPRAQINFNNGGKIAFDETRLYFVGDWNAGDEETCVYSTTYSGEDRKMISSDGSIASIRIADDKILYYSRDDDSKSVIGTMEKDGSNDHHIVETTELIWSYDLVASKLYYVTSEGLHACTADGQNDEILLTDVDEFIISGNGYYNDGDAIYSYDLKKGESKKLCDSGGANRLVYKDNKIFYMNDKGIFSVPDDGSEPETKLVNYDEVRDYLILDDTIYYVQKLSDSELDALVEYFAEGDTQYSKYAYEIVLGSSGFLRSCPVSGGEVAELKTDPLIVADLYGYPEGIYGTVYGMSDVYNKIVIE